MTEYAFYIYYFYAFKAVEVKQFMVSYGITQRFILPASPWWDSFYERLVRSVKMCLKKVLGRAFVTFEELHKILCEIETAINSRPLACACEDDLNEVLPLSTCYMVGTFLNLNKANR